MLDKIKNLFDIKSWAENFLLKTLVNKGVKHAVTFLIGFISGPIFTIKILPLLIKWGITVNPETLSIALGGASSGIAGWIMNWALKVMNPE